MKKIRNMKKYIAVLMTCVIITLTMAASGSLADNESSGETSSTVVEGSAEENTATQEKEVLESSEKTENDVQENDTKEAVGEQEVTGKTDDVIEGGGTKEETVTSQETEPTAKEEEAKEEKQDIIEMTTSELSESVSDLYADIDLDSTAKYVTKTLIVSSDYADFENHNASKIINYDNMYILQYETESNTKNAYKKLKKDESISSVEIDSIIETQSKTNTDAVQEKKQENNNKIKSELAKYIETNTNNETVVKVAIIDTGIDKQSVSYIDRVINLNVNFSTSGENNSIQDDNGHGTDMANIIANNTPSNIKIMPIKVANSDGKASILNTYLGIQAAIDNKANIINISMSAMIQNNSEILANVINEAVKNNIIVVVSAGNSSDGVENYAPANIETAITVSASDETGNFQSFSNYGDGIDYSAVGDNGTSEASTFVTAMIAKIKTINLDYSTADIENILNQYVIDLGDKGFDKYYGNGLISNYDVKSGDTPIDSKMDILNMPDYNTLSDEEFNKYLDNSEPWKIGKYLKNLPKEDYNKVVARNTNISGEITLYDIENSTGEDDTVLLKNPQNMLYYEFCIDQYNDNLDTIKTNSYSRRTGYYTLELNRYDGSTDSIRINFEFSSSADENSSTTFGVSTSSGSNKIWTSNAGNVNGFRLSSAKTIITSKAYTALQIEAKLDLPTGCYMRSGRVEYDDEEFGRMNFKTSSGDNSLTSSATTHDRTVDFSMQVNVRNAGIFITADSVHNTVHNTLYLKIQRDSYQQIVNVHYENADASYSDSQEINQAYYYASIFPTWIKNATDVYEGKSIGQYTVEADNTHEIWVNRISNVSASALVEGDLKTSGWYKGLPTITFTGSDPNLNIRSITINDKPTAGSSVKVTSSEGSNTYNYLATNVNNIPSKPDSVTVKADNSEPINVSISAPTGWSNSNLQLTIKGQDIRSGLESLKVQYSSDNSNWSDYGSKTYDGEINALQTVTDIYASQNGYYRVVATDQVGFTATSSSIHVTNIDKLNPTLTYSITGTLLNGWYKEKADLNLTASDTGGSGVKSITVNDNEANGEKRTVKVITEGPNLYIAYATDNAGNRTTPKKEVTVKVDKSAPINLSMAPNTTEWTNVPVKITAKADDTYSGVDTIELQYTKDKKDKDSWRKYQVESFNGNNQASKDFSVTDNGYYRLIVTDRVGYQTVTADKDILEITNYDPNKPDSNTIGIEPDTIQWVDEPTGVEVTSYGSDELSGLSTVEVLEKNGKYFEPKKAENYSGETTVESATYDTHINEKYLTRITDQAGNKLEMKEVDALEVDNIDPEAPDLTVESISSDEGYISTDKGYVIRAVIEDSQSGFSDASLQKLNKAGEWEDYKAQYQIIRENESEKETDQEVDKNGSKLSKEIRKKYFVAASHISLKDNDKTEEIREQGENKVIIEYTVRENGTYRLRGADLVKNTAYTNDVIEVKNLDGSMPVIRVEGNPTIWQNTDATIQVFATDEDSKIVKMTLDGEEKAITTNESGEYFFPFDATKNQEFTVTAVDEAGNTTTEVIKVTKIDKEAPTLTTAIKKSWLSLIFQDSRNLKINASDSLSGIEKVSVTYQDQETILKNYPYEKAKDSYKGNYKIREEGNYTVTVTDQAGNVSVQAVNEANIDSGSPQLKIEGNPSRWQNKDAVIKVIATDSKSKIKKMTLDNQPQNFEVNESGEAIFSFTVTENQKFVVAAYDEADNVTILPVDITKIDKVAPTIQAMQESKWKDGQRKINVIGADELSGIEQITVNHTYTPELIVSYPYEKQQKNYAGDYSVYENGNYILKIKDKAGNTAFLLLQEQDGKILKAIEVVVPPDKITYYETEDFKKKGMVVDAIYNDNSRSLDIKDYVILNGTSLPLDQNKIDLSYTEMGVTVYTNTPIKVIKDKNEEIPNDPETPENPSDPGEPHIPLEPKKPVISVIPKIPITPNPTPLEPTVPEISEKGKEETQIPSIEKKKIPEKTVKAPDLNEPSKKLPIGAILAGAGLFLIILFFLLCNVKVYSKDEEGEWKFLGKTRALKSKEQYVVHISKLLRIRAKSNSYKLVFSKMFKKFHEECDLVIKIDKLDYEKHLKKDSDTVYVDHKE